MKTLPDPDGCGPFEQMRVKIWKVKAGRPKITLSSSGSCIKDKIQIFSLPFSDKSCVVFLFFFLHLFQVNFSSSLDTGHGSGSGSGSGSTPGSAAGCQSPLPLVTLSPLIHPRIREFRSGLGSTRKGGRSSPVVQPKVLPGCEWLQS